MSAGMELGFRRWQRARNQNDLELEFNNGRELGINDGIKLGSKDGRASNYCQEQGIRDVCLLAALRLFKILDQRIPSNGYQ
eukprot:11575930-Ditylum_brightwellii.AAC.1